MSCIKLVFENILNISKKPKSDLNEIRIDFLNAYRKCFDRDILLKKVEGSF